MHTVLPCVQLIICRGFQNLGMGPKGVCGFVFDDNVFSHSCLKAHAYILNDFAVVDGGFHFPNVEIATFKFSGVSQYHK